MRDPVRIFQNLEIVFETRFLQSNPQVENRHLFRLKTFTDRVVEARQVKEITDKNLVIISISDLVVMQMKIVIAVSKMKLKSALDPAKLNKRNY